MGTLATALGGNGTVKPPPSGPGELPLRDRQQWVLTQLAARGQTNRQAVQQQSGISERTAKRELGESCEAGMVVFDRSEQPGCYRLKHWGRVCAGA